MSGPLLLRRVLIWALAVLAVLIVLTTGLAAAVDADYCRGLLIGYFASRLGRPVQVQGAIKAHLFSLHPQVIAEGVAIGNPPWMPAGLTAQIGRLSLVIKLPEFGHSGGIVGLDMQGAELYLQRDPTGHANWQLTDPAKGQRDENLPIVRSLSMPNAHVMLRDALRHLQFDGTVSAQDLSAQGPVQPLQMQGSGQLNGKAAVFEVFADPLATASHKSPYHFTFTERSNGSRVDGHGVLPRPFFFDLIDATFEAAGPDLKDLYFLTGVTLLDTGDYHLSGSISRRGTSTRFSDLAATTGQSDMRGTVLVESAGGRPDMTLDLNSQILRLTDLGVRAAGRTSEPKSPLLLSDAMVSLNVLRHGEALVNFHAHRLDVGRLPLSEVGAKATIDHDVLTVAPLSAQVLGGTGTVYLRLDATKDIPAASADLRITNLQLGQIDHKDLNQPPIEGLMQARITITGAGRSVHQVAASANGTVKLQVLQGAIRESVAELTGIDLRGLGLLVSKDKQEVPLRCAFADFKAQYGTLIAQRLLLDTAPVLITGDGQIHLDSEALDLVVRGHPKSVRLFRLRTPVLLRGTLAHPSVDIQGSKSVLVLVDPGKAKDADCAALLAD
jgi:AsmA family protein